MIGDGNGRRAVRKLSLHDNVTASPAHFREAVPLEDGETS